MTGSSKRAKKIIMIGKTASGKTTLIQRLENRELSYYKTQAVSYVGNFIDTPGEYLENRMLYRALICLACEAECIALLQDAANEESWFPQGFALMFAKPTIGIVTKADKPDADIARATRFLLEAGVGRVFVTSAVSGQGVAELAEYFHQNFD